MHRSWQLVLSLWLLTVAQGATTPIVTLLRERSGPAAPEAAQWLTTTVRPSQPFSRLAGAAQSQTASPVRGGMCEDTFDVAVANVDVNHTRHADLTVRLATLTAAGEEKTSIVIFDGPALASGKTADEIAAIRIGDLGATPLTWSSTCHTFRLTVTDTGSTAGGQLRSWTLRTRVAWYPFHHDRAYYQALLFGSVFSRPSAANYFREVSRWNQIFTNAGIHGPVAWQRRDWVNAAFSEISAVQAILSLHAEGFRFSDYDTNRDGRVGPDELVILAIDNQQWRGGSLRTAPGGCLDMRDRAGVEVCSAVVLAGTRVDFATLTHELSHALGTADIYGDWAKGECRSLFLTLMSCTISSTPDDRRSVYLDPYHRWRLGWVFPIAFGNSSSHELAAEYYNELGHRARPVILRNSDDSDEYFLFENRVGVGYDDGIASRGLVIWHDTNADGNPDSVDGQNLFAVSPDNPTGGTTAWSPADGRFVLRWRNGKLAPYTFWVSAPGRSTGSIVLHAEPLPAAAAPPTVRIVRPADGSSGVTGLGPYTLEAEAADAATPRTELDYQWHSNVEGFLGRGVRLSYAFHRASDTRVIKVRVKNKFGLTAEASVRFNTTLAPLVATLALPATGTTFARGETIRFSALAEAGGVPLPCSSMKLSVSREPDRVIRLEHPGNGSCEAFEEFDLRGLVRFTLEATDSSGRKAESAAEVRFVELAPGTPATAKILSPEMGWSFLYWDALRLHATIASPPGPNRPSYRWFLADLSSHRTWEIGQGERVIAPFPADFPLRGNFEIRMYGVSRDGQDVLAVQRHTLAETPR